MIYKMPVIKRYPKTNNRSLKPFNAADELLLNKARSLRVQQMKTALLNDRFGYLTCHLAAEKPLVVIDHKSQEKAIRLNLKNNGIVLNEQYFLSPLDNFPESLDLALVQIPKSLNLFKLYLHKIHQASHGNTVVLCGFMTKYFSRQMLKTAEKFFESVEQSRAQKKARLLILKGPKQTENIKLLETIRWNGLELQQYLGVFSSGRIDHATKFLLERFSPRPNEQKILDLASGNGIIAAHIQQTFEKNRWPLPELHLTDDAFLAVESSKLNLPQPHCHHHFSDDLSIFEDGYFDLIITNPPFHFGHEINTEISMNLFTQVSQKLKPGGRFVLVFNRHLVQYRTLLKRLFKETNLLADSPKFTVWECRK